MINIARLRKDEIIWLFHHKCRHGHTYLEHSNCIEVEKPNMCPAFEKVGFLDIEASNLKANFGIVISYCIKEENGKILERIVTPQELRSGQFDKKVIEQLSSDIRTFDRIVTYYGGDFRFDLPFIRTRAVFWGIDFPIYKELKVLDLYPIIKKKFKLHNNRLQTACDFFGIPSKGHRLNPDIWLRAMTGDKKALDFILLHNREDVKSTEDLYHKVIKYSNISNTSI